MSRRLDELNKVLSVGREILSGLKKSMVDMDDVMHDMEHSDDHNATAKKLNDLYKTIDDIPDIPEVGKRKKKKAARK